MSFTQLDTYIATLPEVEVQPHFHKISYRVAGKIFVTIDDAKSEVTIKLRREEQEEYHELMSDYVFSVPNKWGNHGWTIVKYDAIEQKVMESLIKKAYCQVAPKRLAEQINS